jgi:hypothetical protein
VIGSLRFSGMITTVSLWLSYCSNVRSSIGGVTGDGFDMHRPVWVKLSVIFLRGAEQAHAG